MALDATLGGRASNSYVSLEDAATYFGRRLGSDAWDAAGVANQEKALQHATTNLEAVDWVGYRNSPSQALAFPRAYPYNDDPDKLTTGLAIPTAIKNACCEEAIALLEQLAGAEGNERSKMQAEGVTGFTTLGLSERYSAAHLPSPDAPVLCPAARRLVARWMRSTGEIVTDRHGYDSSGCRVVNMPAPRD